MSEAAEKRIAELERELAGVQEMLAFVLATVGEPVVVTHERLKGGLPQDSQIRVDDDLEQNAFVFSITTGDDE